VLPLAAALAPSVVAVPAAQTLSPQVRTYVQVDDPVFALEHVRVIDGTGGPAFEDQTVVVEKGKIRSVGDAKTAQVPNGAKRLDLHDKSVLPGIVGMHDHLFYPTSRGAFAEMPQSFPRLYLACGVTTIRTTGSLEPYTDLEIRKSIEAGKTPGPRMRVTGPYLEGEGSFTPQMHALTGPEDATKTVNYWLDEGVDDFKAYNFLTSAELGAAIRAAHARGAKVTGHLCSIGFRDAAALGIDDLEHGLVVDTEFFPWKKPGECAPDPRDTGFIGGLDLSSGPVQDMIADLVKRKVAVTSTLPVFEMFVPGRPKVAPRVLDAMSSDARSEFQRIKSSIDGQGSSPWGAAFAKEMEFERAFVKAGGLLLAGEDPTGIGGVLAGFGDQREVELLVEAGFTPVEAIAIATSNGAKYLGLEKEIGRIAPGLNADLVVVKGDPSKKIEDVENVETVFKDGVGYDSAKLIESVRGAVGSR
jgi:imidazolonepropionase-like amidohydrolase